MRTIVDIPDAQIKILTQLSKKKKISRAEVIRRALTDYIESSNKNNKNYEAAFGIWKNRELDGVYYQQKLRDEWK